MHSLCIKALVEIFREEEFSGQNEMRDKQGHVRRQNKGQKAGGKRNAIFQKPREGRALKIIVRTKPVHSREMRVDNDPYTVGSDNSYVFAILEQFQ